MSVPNARAASPSNSDGDNMTLTNVGDVAPLMDEHALAAAADADDAYLGDDPLRLAVAAQSADNLGLHDLFGDCFEAPAQQVDDDAPSAFEEPVAEPMLVDLYGILRSVVGEGFVDPITVEYLRGEARKKDNELAHHCLEDELDVLVDTVGAETAAMLKEQKGAGTALPSIVLSAAYPYIKAPTSQGHRESNLLVTLPTILPNCQILHMDPIPFHPSLSIPKDSTPRRIFTAKNTMQWTYDAKSQQFLSNSRMVQWSDGTTTVHVGSESYAMDTFTDKGLTFVGKEQKLYRGDKAIDAVIESVVLDNHVTLRPRSDFKSSVDDVISAASELRDAQDIKTMVGMQVGGLPMLGVATSGKRSLEEEYIEKEKRSLQIRAAERAKNGRPMSMMEMWAEEKLILENVRVAADGIEALVLQQKKEEEDAKKRQVEDALRRSQMRASGGSGRFMAGGKSERRLDDADGGAPNAYGLGDEEDNADLERRLRGDDDESPNKKIRFEDNNTTTTTTTAAASSENADDSEANQKRSAVLSALQGCIASAKAAEGTPAVVIEFLEGTLGDLQGQTKADVKAMQRKVEATMSDVLEEAANFDFTALKASLV